MTDIEMETTIHDLPKELVMHILGYISPWNLFHLSTVSHNWKYYVRISVTELDCSMRKLQPNFYPPRPRN
jgi:acyl-CoA thioesterase